MAKQIIHTAEEEFFDVLSAGTEIVLLISYLRAADVLVRIFVSVGSM